MQLVKNINKKNFIGIYFLSEALFCIDEILHESVNLLSTKFGLF